MAVVDEIPKTRIGLESAGLLMTPEEFDAITDYDELYRYELIHGVLVVTPIAGEAERDPNEELGFLLRLYRETHPQGAALDKTLFEQYVRTANSRRRPDRVIWCGLGRQPDPLTDVPSVVVEFPSAGKAAWRRDYIEKLQEYLALGVREYWVIDRFRRLMTVYSSENGQVRECQIASSEIYRTDLLPGFELPLARLFSAADDWAQS
jgi:Uma2 family endonuclease